MNWVSDYQISFDSLLAKWLSTIFLLPFCLSFFLSLKKLVRVEKSERRPRTIAAAARGRRRVAFKEFH